MSVSRESREESSIDRETDSRESERESRHGRKTEKAGDRVQMEVVVSSWFVFLVQGLPVLPDFSCEL